MTVTIPDYVTAEGNVKVSFVPAIADPAEPTPAELNAGEDVTCFLPETWGGITGEQAKGTQKRMCSKESFEAFGRTARTISAFTYTYLPQEDDADPANAAKAALEPGTEGYIAVRFGPDAPGVWVLAENGLAIKAETGARTYNTTGSDEFAPMTITQEVISKGQLVEFVVTA